MLNAQRFPFVEKYDEFGVPRIIEKETLTAEDYTIAENLLDDLQDALNLNP